MIELQTVLDYLNKIYAEKYGKVKEERKKERKRPARRRRIRR